MLTIAELLLLQTPTNQNFYKKRIELLNIINHPIDMIFPEQLINIDMYIWILEYYIYKSYIKISRKRIKTNKINTSCYEPYNSIIEQRYRTLTIIPRFYNLIGKHTINYVDEQFDMYDILPGMISVKKFTLNNIISLYKHLEINTFGDIEFKEVNNISSINSSYSENTNKSMVIYCKGTNCIYMNKFIKY